MGFNGSDSHRHRWGVILAGGDGKRLLPLTRRIAGDDRPKQFCSILGNETLLQQTQRRISRLIPRPRTLLVLTRTHEPFYAAQVAGMPSSRSIIQPCNRGTAPAILYSVMHLCEIDPQGIVAFFPSDHYFSDEEAFIGHIDSAYIAAASRPEMVILLGITAESPEVGYGWIEPGIPLEAVATRSVSRVSRFWEKPNAAVASELMERGCLWNSFVMVGHVHAFLELIRHALPPLLEAFESMKSPVSRGPNAAALCDLYAGIRATSFSQDVLSVSTHNLAVLRGTGLGWSDLGEPSRVLSILDRKAVQTECGFEPYERNKRALVRKQAAG